MHISLFIDNPQICITLPFFTGKFRYALFYNFLITSTTLKLTRGNPIEKTRRGKWRDESSRFSPSMALQKIHKVFCFTSLITLSSIVRISTIRSLNVVGL